MNVSSAASRRLAVWQNATIGKIVPRTSRVTSFFLKPDRPFSYQAGQHVAVRLTAPDGYRAQRNYSIATSPEDGDVIELAVERLDGGEVSGFFHDVAFERSRRIVFTLAVGAADGVNRRHVEDVESHRGYLGEVGLHVFQGAMHARSL